MIYNFFRTNKEILIVSIFVLLIVFIYSYIVLTINIHGDSKYHALSAKVSVEEGYLTQHQPFRIYNFQNNQRSYMPIAYPLTAESLFTVMYLFGGELMLKLYSPLFATLIFLTAYLCIREIGILQASVSSFFATLAIGERLIMTPLMEPFFILALLTACLLLKKYYVSDKFSLLYLAGFFLGTAACVKQQGLILSAFIVSLVFLFFLYRLIKEKVAFKRLLGTFMIFLFVFIVIPIPALKNQIDRTGTLAYAPGGTGLNSSLPFARYVQPILSSKFPSNPNALKSISEIIGYNKTKINLVNKFQGFLMSPFLYYRSTDVSFYQTYQLMLVSFIILLLFLSLIAKDKKVQKITFVIFLFVALLLCETITSYLFKTPITQYHSFGVLLSTLLIFLFAFRFIFVSSYVRVFILIILTSFFIIGYSDYMYPLWNDSGREDTTQLEAYKRIASFIQLHTPPNAIFLAAETSFRYYAERDFIWLNESIGDTVYDSVSTDDENNALKDLRKLRVNYIVINSDQMQRRGVNDYLPPDGLVSYINHSKNFTKVYDVYGDNQFTVYKVNYLE